MHVTVTEIALRSKSCQGSPSKSVGRKRAFAPVEAGLTETWMASAAPCLPLSKCFEVMVTFVNLQEHADSQWVLAAGSIHHWAGPAITS